MLLHVLRRPGGLSSVSPLLLFAAAIPGSGMLLLLWVTIAAWRSGQTAFVVFLGFFLFLFAVMAFAFWRAASSRVVRCRHEAERVKVLARGATHEAPARDVKLEVTTRTVGWRSPVTLHEVNLLAPQFAEPITVHSGLTRWAAERAAARIREHTGLGR